MYLIRPFGSNVGNALIAKGVKTLVRRALGNDVTLVDIPAKQTGHNLAGLTAASIYEMNACADAVIVGGGNLLENNGMTIDVHALQALTKPLLVLGVGHGRVLTDAARWAERTDAMPQPILRALADRSQGMWVRDRRSFEYLARIGLDAQLGICPSVAINYEPNQVEPAKRNGALVSVRAPSCMSVSPRWQQKVATQITTACEFLRSQIDGPVELLCHDVRDIRFAVGLGLPWRYFSDLEDYLHALGRCRGLISWRLHAFLPAVSMGVPSVHINYDERGLGMIEHLGLSSWGVNMWEDSLESALNSCWMSVMDQADVWSARKSERDATTSSMVRAITPLGYDSE